MGDAAGQITDSLHFLSLRITGFQRTLLGRIDKIKGCRFCARTGCERAHVDAAIGLFGFATRNVDRSDVSAARENSGKPRLKLFAFMNFGVAAEGVAGQIAERRAAICHHANEGGVCAGYAAVAIDRCYSEGCRLEEVRQADFTRRPAARKAAMRPV